MSPVSHNAKDPHAEQRHESGTGQAQKQTCNHSKPEQAVSSSAHEYHQQKRKDSQQGDKNRRQGQAASTLTSQAISRFEQQPRNSLQALDDRIMEYRKSSPLPGESNKNPNERQKQTADRIEAWSDEWEKLKRR